MVSITAAALCLLPFIVGQSIAISIIVPPEPLNCTARLCPRPTCPRPIPPNPSAGQCCPTCTVDCRLVRCALPLCEGRDVPIVPLGGCCAVCQPPPSPPPPSNCSRTRCPPLTCFNPIPAGPGECCPRCLENCAVISCVLPEIGPNCPNTTVPQGRCCPRCTPSQACPVRGQVRGCEGLCPETCAGSNNLRPCPEICRLNGCVCPPGTVIDENRNICVARENCSCPIQGQIRGCLSRCQATCDNPSPNCTEDRVCRPGCVCPGGTVFDARQRRCVNVNQCSCPAGQTMGCRSLCPATCRNPYPFCIQPLVCINACVCAPGYLLDSERNRCVRKSQCSVCPIPGQQLVSCRLNEPPTCTNPAGHGPQLCAFGAVGCVCRSGTVLDEQQNKCVPVSECSNACNQTREVGLCRARLPRYFFNSTSGRCEKFYYGGCGGNGNNFMSLLTCQRKCRVCPIPGQEHTPCFTTQPATCENPNPGVATCAFNAPKCVCKIGTVLDQQQNKCIPASKCSNACSHPRFVGRCRARIPRYFFNSNSGQCEKFYYGGCGGNGNNFMSLSACQRKCRVCPIPGQEHTSCFSTQPPTCEDPNPGGVVSCAINTFRCACRNGTVLDQQQNKCVPVSECSNVCNQTREVGLCRARLPRYFFNSTSGRCEKFYYGGCGGNGNNFMSLSACQRKCRVCPIPGQERVSCLSAHPANCTNPSGGGPVLCAFGTVGCACKRGTVLNNQQTKCIPLSECLICPDGQRRFSCLRNPCDGATCRNHPSAECRADHCGGCNAKWYDNDIEVTDTCNCPPPCSHNYCSRNQAAACSFQSSKCTGPCRLSNCNACYYSSSNLHLSFFSRIICPTCDAYASNNRKLEKCLHRWSICVRRLQGNINAIFRSESNFRCWNHPCVSNLVFG